MIREAKFFDIIRCVELLHEMQENSKYAGRVKVVDKAAHRLLTQCLHRHGHTNEGGAFFMVSVRDQKVEGFMVGLLDRVYHIGDKLASNDVFLYCSERADKMDFVRLFDAYTNWAESNPKVIEVRASWTDAREGAERIEGVYEKRGFRKCGAIWEKRPEIVATEEAA